MGKYYDGTKLLSLTDINGERPELYMCTSNRTAGKTTWFSRMLVNGFKKRRDKFCLVYRYSYELDDVSDKFFKDIGSLFFKGDELVHEKRAKGTFAELYLNDESCGYAVALNTADQIKKYSHLFSDVACMLFDEFQSETNKYCSDELTKFISVHTSIARGQGEQVRRVPVYMLSNPVSLINPYYAQLGVSYRLRDDTKFLRGDGWVLEQGFVQDASDAQKQSGFNRAFAGHRYLAYAQQNVYLNDSRAFIERPEGKNRYICTLKCEGANYAVRCYEDAGVVYCDTSYDAGFPMRISLTTKDHDTNYVMLKRNAFLLSNLRYYFDHGAFRFKDLQCKEVVMRALSY